MNRRDDRFVVVTCVIFAALCIGALPPRVAGQGLGGKESAVLVVDGSVARVFTSSREGRSDYLVEIEVARADVRAAPEVGGHIPVPGEVIYVYSGILQNIGSAPVEGMKLRAYLLPQRGGTWQGTSGGWFQSIGDGPAAAERAEAPSVAGMSLETVKHDGKTMLRVTAVERGSPAGQAGLEVGDIIAAAGQDMISSARDFQEKVSRSESLPLVVIDVNTGRSAQVTLHNVGGGVAAKEQPSPPAERRSLGLSAETVSLGQRTALKVTRVEPGGPAQKAGIEPGDVLVAAEGVEITGPEPLAGVLRKSGPKLTVTVRDSRTGRDVPVEIIIDRAQAPQAPLPMDVPAAGAGTSVERLGIVTELAFMDTEAAVKVTEVRPDSPAARAGVRTGMIITQADGKPVLHSNDLAQIVRQSGATLQLSVMDPATGKRGTIRVELGR